jgi:hypothetical protein
MTDFLLDIGKLMVVLVIGILLLPVGFMIVAEIFKFIFSADFLIFISLMLGMVAFLVIFF